MKNLSPIARLTGMALLMVLMAACSSEQWRRTSYETLKAAEHQRCLNEAYSDCPRQGDYEAYQQQREQELQSTNSK